MKRVLIATAMVSTLALAACNSDLSNPGSLQLTTSDTLQALSLSASDATAEDVDLLSAAEASFDSPGATPAYSRLEVGTASYSTSGDSARGGFWGFSGSCTYSSASGRFACPDVAKNGLTLTRSAAFTDANGAAQSRYNDTTTASANFQMSVTGVHPTLFGADTISRQRNMTATGLVGRETTRTWNGTGSRSDAGYAADGAWTRSYKTQDATTIANVVVKLPRREFPWPQSGTITRLISGTGTASANGASRTFTVNRTVTITFNGTRLVPMKIGDVAYVLDLFTGRAAKA